MTKLYWWIINEFIISYDSKWIYNYLKKRSFLCSKDKDILSKIKYFLLGGLTNFPEQWVSASGAHKNHL